MAPQSRARAPGLHHALAGERSVRSITRPSRRHRATAAGHVIGLRGADQADDRMEDQLLAAEVLARAERDQQVRHRQPPELE